MEVVTTDLSKFGQRELKMLELLLTAMREKGLPREFEFGEVVPMMNMNHGTVFLSNEHHQVAMLTDENKLESFYSCSNCGHEGFKDDFDHETDDEECIEQMHNVGLHEPMYGEHPACRSCEDNCVHGKMRCDICH